MKTLLRITTLFLLLAPAFHATAQDEDMPPLSSDRLKEIKAQKTAYLTTKLGLTSDEAQRFWPIYNEYDDAREKLHKEMRELHKSASRDGALDEAKAREVLNKGLDIRTRELDLGRTFSDRFVKSIGAVKTVQLVKAERDFNREVLRRFKEKMEDRRGDQRGPPPDGRR
ncbi:MAG: hypothetical protein IPP83_10310 [Flavobacteriales bacterium]|nr:hypothetical protein [Flavobacteriales bacterium]MBL0127825.1 hypothetical protein [Flavobacteriales bacterium]MCC6937627.1 hypothetical protein [Flavobacteriales bacterium]